jgi:hypothetical protein
MRLIHEADDELLLIWCGIANSDDVDDFSAARQRSHPVCEP